MRDDGARYVTDGRLDIGKVRNDHRPDRGEETCVYCHEEWPCSIAHAADRMEDFRAGRARREWQ